MKHQNPSDEAIRELLLSVRTIAVVGASDKTDRPVYGVMKFLQGKGKRILPVSPRLNGEELLGEAVVGALEELPGAPDLVDVFINPNRLEPVVSEAIALGAPALWLQLGVVDDALAERAVQAGLVVVMDRCPAIEWRRLRLDEASGHEEPST